MPKMNTPGCNCCCKNTPFFVDRFEDPENRLPWEGAWRNFEYVPSAGGGYRVAIDSETTGTRSMYKEVNTGSPNNLFVNITCTMREVVGGITESNPDCLLCGVFIGNLARVVWYRTEPGAAQRCYLQWPVDEFGNSELPPGGLLGNWIDLGFLGIGHSVSLAMQNSWEGDTGAGFHVFFRGTGGLYHDSFITNTGAGETYGFALPPMVPSLKVGIIGSANAKFDNVEIISNHNGNDTCFPCWGIYNCPHDQIVKEYDLSVPEIESGDPEVGCICANLSGDFVLRYRLYANRYILKLDVGCNYMTDVTTVCNPDHLPPYNYPGNAWNLSFNGAWFLEATNARNILKYVCLANDFVCGEPVTFHYDDSFPPCGFGEPCCTNPPETLTIIPRA